MPSMESDEALLPAPQGKQFATNSIAAPVAFQRVREDFTSSDWINSINPPAPRERSEADTDHPPSLLPQDLTDEELAMLGLPPVGETGPAPLAEPTPGFVRQARRAQRWRSPWARMVLLLLALGLLAALGLQVAYHERDRIAAAQPRALPWLQALCRYADCTVGPLRQIESVVVDASGFNKLRSEGKNELYKFTLNLKNNGALSVAIPHIELTLNDGQDQPLMRRVLNPVELGAAQPVLVPAGEFAGSTTVQIDSAQLGGARVAGYRVWAFYP